MTITIIGMPKFIVEVKKKRMVLNGTKDIKQNTIIRSQMITDV